MNEQWVIIVITICITICSVAKRYFDYKIESSQKSDNKESSSTQRNSSYL